jgi:mRNA-degrading endonuclease RelE of RelBE toxin-antitoxin system
MPKPEDEKFAETVKRMLQTPHKPHEPLKKKSKRKLTKGKGRVRVGRSRG